MSSDNFSRGLRKFTRKPPRIIGNGDRDVAPIMVQFFEILTQSMGGATDVKDIDARSACADNTPEASGAELKIAKKPIF